MRFRLLSLCSLDKTWGTGVRIALYVTGHGFGHATRQVALLEELSRMGSLEVLLRTEAPQELFDETGLNLRVVSDRFDVGMIQASALTVDIPATFAAHHAVVTEFDSLVAKERARLIEFSPDIVLSDCGAVPMEAARGLDIPAITIGSFTWDWILEEFAKTDPRWEPIVRRYAKAYAAADAYWRLPFHGKDGQAFKTVRDFPHLVRRPRMERAETLSALGLPVDEERAIVTVAFGGFETQEFTGADPELPENCVFVGFTEPPPGFKKPWIRLPKQSPVRTVDLARVTSVLVGKLGYGTVAECLVYGTRMLYVPRPGIREIPFIEREAHSRGGFRKLSADDFYSARWKASIDAILEIPVPAFTPGDGAEHIAKALFEKMRVA